MVFWKWQQIKNSEKWMLKRDGHPERNERNERPERNDHSDHKDHKDHNDHMNPLWVGYLWKFALALSAVSAIGLVSRTALALGPMDLMEKIAQQETGNPSLGEKKSSNLSFTPSAAHLGCAQGAQTPIGCIWNYDASFMIGEHSSSGTGAYSAWPRWVNTGTGDVMNSWIQSILQSNQLAPFFQIHIHQYFLSPALFGGPSIWNGSGASEKPSAPQEMKGSKEQPTEKEQEVLPGLIAV